MAAMEVLSRDEANEILSQARTRGLYRELANGFTESGADGMKFSLTEGPFANAKASTVYQGFRNVVDTDAVRVIQREDSVVLIRK